VDLIFGGIRHAFQLLLRGDPEVMQIMWLSIRVSGLATALSLVVGVPLGMGLALQRFPGRTLLLGIINSGMGLPPVVVGLVASVVLWRTGPLGFLNLLYTPAAIVAAQFALAMPVVAGLTAAAIQQLDSRLRVQLVGLGASRLQVLRWLLHEARLPLLAAVIAGFGAVISEVGASMMVGGNILHYTRVLTTATVLETAKGNFDVAIALSVVLLAVTFCVTMLVTAVQQRGAKPA
jgi:tungstate transport system permease protein